MKFDPSNPNHADAIRRSLSAERLAPYEAMAGAFEEGLRLYQWNTSVSAAVYGTLQTVEVVLRNSLHEQMTLWHKRERRPGTWLDDPAGLFDTRRIGEIADARERIHQAGYGVTPERIVTELSFGFWRFLLSGRYHNVLWVPALRHAFKELRPQRRREIYEPLERLHRLRNRIAHHEPIHRRNLALDHTDALRILAAICPVTRSWAHLVSNLPAVLTIRPRIPAPRQPQTR